MLADRPAFELLLSYHAPDGRTGLSLECSQLGMVLAGDGAPIRGSATDGELVVRGGELVGAALRAARIAPLQSPCPEGHLRPVGGRLWRSVLWPCGGGVDAVLEGVGVASTGADGALAATIFGFPCADGASLLPSGVAAPAPPGSGIHGRSTL
jgi:hypothetical protein